MATPDLVFDALTAYQRSAALKAAIELDLFTSIGEGARHAEDLASRCAGTARGVRSLCDSLVAAGFLTKDGNAYGLTEVAATYLDRNAPGYMGSVASFLGSPELTGAFGDVAEVVRTGRPRIGSSGTMAPDHPVWIEFARGMAPVVAPQAKTLAEHVGEVRGRVLDVAAGHGLYGIAVAQRNPEVEIVALDWDNVLAIARENARAAGLGERFSTFPGSAMEVDLGGPYELVLVPNFLHHFDLDTCVAFLERVRARLAPGGRVVVLASPTNEDRVSPPKAAHFALVMLVTTAGGESYTEVEYRDMFARAGFPHVERSDLTDSTQSALTATV